MRQTGCRRFGFQFGKKGLEPRNRMREIFKYGSVGRALRKRCLYPEADDLKTSGLRKGRASLEFI